MKQPRFPRQYYLCRVGRCRHAWAVSRPDDKEPLPDPVCPHCSASIHHKARDERGIPILGEDRLPIPAIQIIEGAENFRRWKRRYFEESQSFFAKPGNRQEVRIQGWIFDVVQPQCTHAEMVLYLNLIRFTNDIGVCIVGQGGLADRLEMKAWKLRPDGLPNLGSQSTVSRMLKKLASLWIYWELEHREECRPLVSIERRARSNVYHVLTKIPEGALKIRAGGMPRDLRRLAMGE